MNHPRTNVAGIIIRDNHILLVEFEDDSGLHYNFPGGGVDLNETLHDAVKREVMEETRAQVEVGKLLAVMEYIPPDNDTYGNWHKVLHLFECSLLDDSEPRLPDVPDKHQTGVKWIALDKLTDIQLYPELGQDVYRVIRGDLDDVFYGAV